MGEDPRDHAITAKTLKTKTAACVPIIESDSSGPHPRWPARNTRVPTDARQSVERASKEATMGPLLKASCHPHADAKLGALG